MLLLTLLGLAVLVEGHQVCFPRYGCFSDDPPFSEVLTQLPKTPEELDIKCLLFTRNHMESAHVLNALNETTIHTADFDSSKKTIFIIHGYIESSRIFWIRPMVNALLKREDANVIVVDWEKGSPFPYHQAYGNARLIGAILADLVNVLINTTNLQLPKLHCIGFSMGAQICGYVGRNLRREGKFLGRITALDPAGPLYEYKDREVRLDTSDAEFVDVIHTDADTIIIKGFGLEQITGHLDFYPNNGKFQPNCRDISKGPAMFVTCSHWRATMYFTESISSKCPFYGYSCKTYDDFTTGLCDCGNGKLCPTMGYDAVNYKDVVGRPIRYYMKTDGNKPFCVYHYRVVLYTGNGIFQDLDANVKLIVTDENGQSERLPIQYRKLNSGSTEYFLSTTKTDLGDLRSVQITHDALLDVWYLLKVVIQPLWKDIRYMGCYKRWLNSDQNTVQLRTDTEQC